jgi:hypothetical protein
MTTVVGLLVLWFVLRWSWTLEHEWDWTHTVGLVMSAPVGIPTAVILLHVWGILP